MLAYMLYQPHLSGVTAGSSMGAILKRHTGLDAPAAKVCRDIEALKRCFRACFSHVYAPWP